MASRATRLNPVRSASSEKMSILREPLRVLIVALVTAASCTGAAMGTLAILFSAATSGGELASFSAQMNHLAGLDSGRYGLVLQLGVWLLSCVTALALLRSARNRDVKRRSRTPN